MTKIKATVEEKLEGDENEYVGKDDEKVGEIGGGGIR